MTFHLRHLRRLPLALEATAWLIVAWLALDVLPGRLYRWLLPSASASNEVIPEATMAPSHRKTASVAWAVERLSQSMPFRSVCFHRGIAAQWMLRRRGVPSRLHYGVARDAQDRALRAHVWVSSNGQDVVGGSVKQQFHEIAQFSPENVHTLARSSSL